MIYLQDPDAVERLGVEKARLHSDAHVVRSSGGTGMPAPPTHASDLALFLQHPERQTVLSLSTFDSQIRQKRGQGGGCLHVGLPPPPEWPPAFGVRIFGANITSERLGKEVKGGTLNLPNVDALGVRRLPRIANDAHGVRVALDADRAVRIEHASQVCESRFVHTPILPDGGDVTGGGDALWPRSTYAIQT